MTKEEYIRICEMLNGSKEDTELAIGIINQAYNESLYKKLFSMNFNRKNNSYMNDLGVDSRTCSIVSVYAEIIKHKNKDKYIDIFKYIVELRVKLMSELSGLKNVIKNIDVTLNEE
jgi:hypothetical protein